MIPGFQELQVMGGSSRTRKSLRKSIANQSCSFNGSQEAKEVNSTKDEEAGDHSHISMLYPEYPEGSAPNLVGIL